MGVILVLALPAASGCGGGSTATRSTAPTVSDPDGNAVPKPGKFKSG